MEIKVSETSASRVALSGNVQAKAARLAGSAVPDFHFVPEACEALRDRRAHPARPAMPIFMRRYLLVLFSCFSVDIMRSPGR